MGVDQTSLDRIRNATFPSSRRGYDKREVEKFLARLADWLETGGGDESRSDVVKRELERVGQRTGAILSQAEESAEQIRAEAGDEAEQTREEADAYSEATRAEADTYVAETRKQADQDAGATRVEAEHEAGDAIAAAQEKARRIVEEGNRRRQDIESVITDLVSRRNEVLADTDALADKLSAAAHEHRPAGEDPFATPADFDPLGEGADADGGPSPESEAPADGDQPEDLEEPEDVAGEDRGDQEPEDHEPAEVDAGDEVTDDVPAQTAESVPDADDDSDEDAKRPETKKKKTLKPPRKDRRRKTRSSRVKA